MAANRQAEPLMEAPTKTDFQRATAVALLRPAVADTRSFETATYRPGLLVVLVTLFVVGCAGSPAPLSNAYAPMDLAPGEPFCLTTTAMPKRCLVSIINLIATPEKFNHFPIQVVGYATLGFEHNVLYLSREAAAIHDSHSAIWLDVGGLTGIDPAKLGDHYVVVAGTFNAERRGHLGGFAGTIQGIFRFEKWP